MKIGIIDNETRYLQELIQFAKNDEVNSITVFKYDQLDMSELESYDLVILSGGHTYPVMLDPEKYRDEINFIRTDKKPILGICMGFEIVAYAFGSDLERMPNKESRVLELKILRPSLVTGNFQSIKVHEHHRWHVKKLGTDLIPLAESVDGVEIIKHKTKPIYGFQFHPELDPSRFQSLLQNLK